MAGATSIARATAQFSKKNARFFAGYAFDARQVPFAWTPPGRVFVGIDLERTALLDEDGVQEGRGRWGGEAVSHTTFRSHKQGPDPLAELPADIAASLGRSGEGVLTVAGSRGPVVLPARWLAEPAALYAALPAETLALAGAGPDAPVALTSTRPANGERATWSGAMVQGEGSIYLLDSLGSGAKTAKAAGRRRSIRAPDALVRIRPSRTGLVEGLVERQRAGRDDHGRVLGRGRRAARARCGR